MKITKRGLRSWRLYALVGLAASLSAPLPATAQGNDVVVFAAASLKNALDDINASWTAATGKKVTVSYAASSALARQIESGAPADVFISADLAWMDYLADKDLIRGDTRTDLLGNRIVLIAPKGSAATLGIAPGLDLAKALNGGRLAMGNVGSVPAGKYGKAALESLGAWEAVKDSVAQAENVRAGLQLVARGEAPLGIVYRTDAAADPGVKIVGTFPENTHPPIVYPIAITAGSRNADAKAFANYVRSPAARPAFEKQGFIVFQP